MGRTVLLVPATGKADQEGATTFVEVCNVQPVKLVGQPTSTPFNERSNVKLGDVVIG